MSDSAFLLLHSPLLGPVSWHPARDELTARGGRAVVPNLVDAVTGRGPHIPAIARSVLQAVDSLGQPLALVAHSGPARRAGRRRRCTDAVAAVVFVDATLPYPGRSWFESAPTDLGDRLRILAGDDDVLPPWHTWFGPDAIAELVPDPVTRAVLCADVPRVPLSYLAETAPPELGWKRVPTCYLRLSDAYLDAEAVAVGEGWPTASLPDAHHLSGYTEPPRVVMALESLLANCVPGSDPAVSVARPASPRFGRGHRPDGTCPVGLFGEPGGTRPGRTDHEQSPAVRAAQDAREPATVQRTPVRTAPPSATRTHCRCGT